MPRLQIQWMMYWLISFKGLNFELKMEFVDIVYSANAIMAQRWTSICFNISSIIIIEQNKVDYINESYYCKEKTIVEVVCVYSIIQTVKCRTNSNIKSSLISMKAVPIPIPIYYVHINSEIIMHYASNPIIVRS